MKRTDAELRSSPPQPPGLGEPAATDRTRVLSSTACPGGDLHPWLVRPLVVIIIALSVSVAAMPLPKRLPVFALGSAALYRLEVGAAAVLLSTLVLALLARGLVLGRFPTTLGRDGVGWELDSQNKREDRRSA